MAEFMDLKSLGTIFAGIGAILLGWHSLVIEPKENKKREAETIDWQKKVIAAQKESSEKSANFEKLQQKIYDLQTGGSGYPKIEIASQTFYDEGVQTDGDRIQLFLRIRNTGDYPFKKFKVRTFNIKDFTNADTAFLFQDLASTDLNFPTTATHIPPKMKAMMKEAGYTTSFNPYDRDSFAANALLALDYIGLEAHEKYLGINLFIQSDHQYWIILARYVFDLSSNSPNIHPQQSFVVFSVTDQKLLVKRYESNVDALPKLEDGTPKWFRNKIPESWFSDRKQI